MGKLFLIIFLVLSSSNFAADFNSRNIDYGVTIITHGAQFFSSSPIGWMTSLAEAIRTRAGTAKILKYNKTTGVFEALPNYDSSGEIVLLFDWVSESDNPSSGFSEAAGDALFSALMLGEINGDFTLENLHFIGHSRGCTINSEAVERLLKIGKPVEQVTNLDPHDWGPFPFSTDYDVNDASLNISDPSSRSPNRGVVSWEGVGWIDTYWQTVGFAGRSVYGSYNLQLQPIGHSEVYQWYEGTINNVSGNDSWFQDPYPARNESGYNYSRIGGLVRRAEWGTRQFLLIDFETDGIINGDFERGPSLNQNEYPGWSNHGGGGSGDIISNKLVLNQSNNSREHNRFYIPNDVDLIKFLLKINTAESGYVPSVDKFKFSIKSDHSGSTYNLLTEEYNNAVLEKWIELDISEYKNSVATILLDIEDGGGNGINSEVHIDDISFSRYPLQLVDITVNLEGTMQTDLLVAGLIPNAQPYNIFPWNYDGTESVISIPDNVVDWVLVELRDEDDNTKIISTRAAFLLNNGKIVDLDGNNSVSFLMPSDFYYIVVKHRNHLEIMSANPIEITNQ